MKPKINFQPFKRDDNRYAIEVLREEKSIGFIHWIESADGKLCLLNRADMVMSPIWTIEECQANCNWLEAAYQRGEIK